MSGSDDGAGCAMAIAWVIGVLAGCGFGSYAGCDIARFAERQRAIEAGVARYVVDPQTGATEFVYGEE